MENTAPEPTPKPGSCGAVPACCKRWGTARGTLGSAGVVSGAGLTSSGGNPWGEGGVWAASGSLGFLGGCTTLGCWEWKASAASLPHPGTVGVAAGWPPRNQFPRRKPRIQPSCWMQAECFSSKHAAREPHVRFKTSSWLYRHGPSHLGDPSVPDGAG